MIKKSYMFIVREFNDIDHFTPLLDALCTKENYKVSLFASNIAILEIENENINYLKKQHGLTLEYLLAEIKLPIWSKIAKKIYLSIHIKTLNLVIAEKLRWALDRILLVLLLFFSRNQIKSNSKWAENIIKRVNPDVIIFDWTYPDIFPNKPIVEIAKRESIPVIALPHGLNIWTNFDHTIQGKSSRNRSFEGFDYVVSQGSLATSHLKHEGWPSEKIIEIGSMRFSREWLAKYGEIFTRKRLDRIDAGEKIKVVLFLSKPKYQGKVENVKKYIKFLASRDDICLVIKPHTRRMKVDFLKNITDNYSAHLTYDSSSYELSQWCDIGIVYGSSIGLQILADGKLLIYPTEFDRNNSIYEKYSSACIVNDLDSMEKELNNFKVQKEIDYYTQDNVNSLFENEVYAGNLDRNLINDQLDFLNTLSSKHKAA